MNGLANHGEIQRDARRDSTCKIMALAGSCRTLLPWAMLVIPGRFISSYKKTKWPDIGMVQPNLACTQGKKHLKRNSTQTKPLLREGFGKGN